MMLMVKSWCSVILGISFVISLLCKLGASFNLQSSNKDVTIIKEVLAGRQVYVYRAYKDVQIFHFSVPPQVSSAEFNFTANGTLQCEPRNITIYLQAGSYPVVNPDGAKYPEGLWLGRQSIYSSTLLSDLSAKLLSVPAPLPSHWFMIAFINDDSNRITQAGLFPSCYSWLQAEVLYHQENNVITLVARPLPSLEPSLSITIDRITYFRVYVPSPSWLLFIHIEECSPLSPSNNTNSDNCPLVIALRPRGLPRHDFSDTKIVNCSSIESINCSLETVPQEESWHYISLSPLSPVNISIYSSIQSPDSPCVDCTPYRLPEFTLDLNNDTLQMHTLEEIFKEVNLSSNMIDEETNLNLTIDDINIKIDNNDIVNNNIENSTNTLDNLNMLENIESVEIYKENGSNVTLTTREGTLSFRFPARKTVGWPRHNLVRKTYPGNFVFEFDLPPDENGSVPLMLNITNNSPTLLHFELEPVIDIGGSLAVELAVFPFMNRTAHNYSIIACISPGVRSDIAESGNCSEGYTLKVNTGSMRTLESYVLAPYPEPGPWLITLVPACYLTNLSEIVPCTIEHTTVLFSINSASCLHGKCGQYGSCYQYISGGFIFATCVCNAGYKGWGCTDNSDAISSSILLLATLLLTLSNLLFFPAIILAIKRRFFAEALIYTFTMFFSTFYHACDQEIFSFCMMKLSVLQFCDFYSAILAFWVTLILMADLPHFICSILHLAGAVLIALGVEYDRTGLWVFAIPSISAFLVMTIAWIWHSKKDGTCYPRKKYWLKSLLPGTALAVLGLVCYAFLETHDNYQYVHSFWHSTMALAIVCLLPPRRFNRGNFTVETADSEVQNTDGQILTVNMTI